MALPRLPLLSQICITHFISHIHMLVLPALMPLILLSNHSITFVEIGFAISIFNIVSALVQAPVGFFVDKLGPKRVLIAGLLIGSFSFLSLGFIDDYIWLVIAMGIIGIANAVYHPADYAILSQNVNEEKMGRAFSLHTFSGMIGFAVTPTLMLSVVGFSNVNMAFVVSGAIGLFAAIILIPKSKEDHNKNIIHCQNGIKKSSSRSPESTASRSDQKNKVPLITSSIFLMFIIFLLLSLSGSSIQNFSVSALTKGYPISLFDANIALTTFLVSCSVGILAGGYLADCTKKHGLIAAIALILTSVIAFILFFVPLYSTILIIIMIGVMGFLFGIITPSRDMLVRSVAPKGSEGKVFGIVSTGFNIGGAVGPLIFGWILDNNYPKGVFLFAAIFMALTAVITIHQELKSLEKQK